MSTTPDILTAFRRSERALAEQITEWESLDFGVAFTSSRFAILPEANQLRDVWLAEIDGEAAYARAEAYYSERGLKCRSWTSASGQSVEPVESLLLAKGWRRVEHSILALADWSAPAIPLQEKIRILPARAMRKAWRATFDETTDLGAQSAEAAMERLNDPDLDAFVAMCDRKPAGRLGYFSVGDIARLTDLHIAADPEAESIAAALIAHTLQLGRRLSPKVIVAGAAPTDESRFTQRGFVEAGRSVIFARA